MPSSIKSLRDDGKRASAQRVTSSASAPTSLEESSEVQSTRQQKLLVASAVGAAFCWSYWPTLGQFIHAWQTQPDYSHGWLVVPVAAYILWQRRAECPAPSHQRAWLGLVMLLVSLAMRVAGSLWFLNPLAGWSIPVWTAGACLLLFGWPVLRWGWPAIAFLVFMIPLPFRSETLLSTPMQAVATRLSCFALQCLGEPAIREGNVILLGEHKIAVAEACSGLRIFISIVALAFGFLLLIRKPARVNAGLVLALLPIALATNALRIVVTAWLQGHISGEAAHRFSHDAAGWLMMPVAAAMMAATVVYCERLFVAVAVTAPRDALLGNARVRSLRS